MRDANFFLARFRVTHYLFMHHASNAMNATDKTNPDEPASRTRIAFDLAAVLTPEELMKFQAAAEEAHAPNLTEHFLNLTLRVHHAAA